MDIKWSAVVGTRNTANLIKSFVDRWTRLVPSGEHYLIIVDSGTDVETKLLFNNHNFKNVYYHQVDESFTLSDTYNYGVKKSHTDYISFLHNDIWLPDNYFDKLTRAFEDDKVCISKRIEPIIFANSISRENVKYVNCGNDWETLDEEKIYKNMNDTPDLYGSKYFNFFISFHRNVWDKIEGMDNLFDPMFCEDDDLIKRWCMAGVKIKLMGSVQFYHMPSQTSRYSKEFEYKTKAIEDVSNKNYIRKWGTKIGDILIPKIKNALICIYESDDQFYQVLKTNEMFFSYVIFASSELNIEKLKTMLDKYLLEEQKYTQFDLSKKIFIVDSKHITEKVNELDINYFIIRKKFIEINTLLNINNIVVNSETGKYMIDPNNLLMIVKKFDPSENIENAAKLDRTGRIDQDLWLQLRSQRSWKNIYLKTF